MDSVLQLDPASLANLARRAGAGDVELADGRLAFSINGRRVEVAALTVAGRVTVDGVTVDLREVRPGAGGMTITFAVVG